MMNAVLKTAMEIQNEAANTALKHFRRGISVDLKSDESPVTDADLSIERDARKRILDAFPDHEILGEEFGAGDLTKDHVWVIDPIDGTRSFISGNPAFGFLLSYLEGGRNRLSIVAMPYLNEVFVGEDGKGATLNGSPIRTSGIKTLSKAVLYINEGEKLAVNEPEVHARLIRSGHTRRFAYDCYPHALLAAGFIDCVVDYDLKPFDYLPLAGVIEAAGGTISDWNGNKLDFGSDGRIVSAATPELHREMLEILSPQCNDAASSKTNSSRPDRLLTLKDGPPFEIVNGRGKSPIVLVCEHAANRVPECLELLGLDDKQLASHVGWDPGALELAIGLSEAFDAPLIAARFSRLVYDCNRPPDAPSSIPAETEVCPVPGNRRIDAAARQRRVKEIYRPFHLAIEQVLSDKLSAGLDRVLVTVHSFTPVFNGQTRSVEIGLLHATDDRLSKALEFQLSCGSTYDIRLNQPYGPEDGVLHSIEKHLKSGGFPYVMIEVRNDLLADKERFSDILSLLSSSIPKAVSGLGKKSNL